jgi:hypothetical protein
MTQSMQLGIRAGTIGLLCAILAGCVTRVPSLRVFPHKAVQPFSGNERVLVVSILPGRTAVERSLFKESVIQEVRRVLGTPVLAIGADDDLSEYVTPANLIAYGDTINVDEVSRLGRVVGASHVLCVLVRSSRTYHPQLMSTAWVLVESEKSSVILQMDALFDAADQDTVREMGRYLRARRARSGDMPRLEQMLRSPREYGRFVASLCSRALADSVYGGGRLKKR